MFGFVNETNFDPTRSQVTVAEAASLLGVSEPGIRKMAAAGEFGAYRHGRSWVLQRDLIEREARLRGRLPDPISPKGVATSNGDDLVNLSFFSGAMGLDLGLERAGIRTVLACENEKWCRATIVHNRPDLPLLNDVGRLSAAEVRAAAGLAPDDEIDVVSGGPPCQAFSTAGARRGFQDPRGNVFLQFLDLVAELAPRYVILENVRGLLSAPLAHRPHSERGEGFKPLTSAEQPGGALREVLRTLRSAGYEVSFNLYNAANYGTPQIRERVVILASRDGGRIPHLSPTHSNRSEFGLAAWKTFEDAVADLDAREAEHLDFPESRLKYYRMLGPGQYWKHLPDELQREALGRSYFSGGGKTGFYRRLAWDRPSPTLVTHPAMPATDLAHPELDRPLSIQEYKRVQQFPDDWELCGKLIARYKQVGNAVPTGLGEAIGRAIVEFDSGEVVPEIDGFPYSRYKRNCDRTWGVQSDAPSEAPSRQLSLA